MIRTVVYYTDGHAFGGVEQVVLTILAGLDRQRWRPLLLHHPESGTTPLIEGAGRLDVERIPVPRMEGMALARAASCVQVLRTEHVDVFHAHLNWPLACRNGLVAAILARVPAVVATEHLFRPIPWRRSVALQRLVSLGVDRYIAVSRDTASRLRQTLQFPWHKIQVIHNGVALTSFDRTVDPAIRAGLSGPSGRPVVLVPARLDAQKGHRYLLEAAVLVPDAVFILVGDGPEDAALHTQVRTLRLDDRVTFLGYRTDMADLMLSCDLVVIPSLFEGLPLVVLEAMAAGRPVIATAVDGTGEAVVDGETGFLVPPKDPAMLAAAIRTVLDAPLRAQKLGAAGRDRARREFDAAMMVRRTEAVYDDILCRSGR